MSKSPKKQKNKKSNAKRSRSSEPANTPALDLGPPSTLHVHLSCSDNVKVHVLHSNTLILDGITPADVEMLVYLKSMEGVKRMIEFPLVVVLNPGVETDNEGSEKPKKPSKKERIKPKKKPKGPVKVDELRQIYKNNPARYYVCCIDMLPIVIGEQEFRIRCLCQSLLPPNDDERSLGIEVEVTISWQDTEAAASALEEASIIFLTVEKAYGLPGQRYTVDTVIPGQEGDSGEKITFSTCRHAKHGTGMKVLWRAAGEFGAAASSDYRLDDEEHNIYNESSLDLSPLFDEESGQSCLLWTSLHRSVLWPPALDNLRQSSTLQWTFHVNNLETRKQFVATANFEVLLEPGETCVRVATPLLPADGSLASGGRKGAGEGAQPPAPALLLVKIELSQPLVKAYTHEQIYEKIDRHIPEAPKEPPKSKFTTQEETFKSAVRQVESSIQDHYLQFCQTHSSDNLREETWAQCYMMSWTTEPNEEITTKLAKAVAEFVGDDSGKKMDEIDHAEAVSWWYANAVSAMHLGLNQEAPPVLVAPDPGELADARSMADFIAYRKLLLQTLCASPDNIDMWLALASLQLRDDDDEAARIALHRALQIDQRHPISLLCYGSLLLSSEPKEAQWFVRGVLLENPDWLEGWAAARALFWHQGQLAAAHVAKLQIHRTSLRPDPPEGEIKQHLPYWTYNQTPNDPTLLAAEMLAKYGAFQWAELCINSHVGVDQSEKTRALAKLKLLSGKVEESTMLASLATRLSKICAEARWLEAECLWASGSRELAAKMWLASGAPPPPAARARIGLQLLKSRNIKEALLHYSVACQNAPSTYAWTGLGLAHWELGSEDLAERCLVQATRLGGKDAWLHLSWLNRRRGKDERAERCLNRAKMMGVLESDIPIELQRCWTKEVCPVRVLCAMEGA